MKPTWPARRGIALWQLLFILLSTSWLLAPHLNHLLSYRTSLISQYEAPGQPFAWLFRLCDIAGASLLIWLAFRARVSRQLAAYFLVVIGAGMLVDAVWPVSCHYQALACQEYFSPSFVVHAAETTITATAIFILSVYDGWVRRRLVSIGFVIFQLVYAGLFISQLADQEHFNTLSQYIYQLLVIVWIAWLCRDIFVSATPASPGSRRGRLIKLLVAAWAFLNGLVAIILSLTHLHLLGRIKGLYFAGNHAWLAQHGVIAGVVLLYLSRHLARGELRARQLFLVIAGLEVLEYALLSPNLLLMGVYLLTFCGLFVLRDEFDRGVAAITIETRLKDAVFLLSALLLAALLGLEALMRTNRLSRITSQSIDNFFDYTLRSRVLPHTQLKSALLAHTISAFLVAGIAAILWTLFRPSKQPSAVRDEKRVADLLARYSRSSEDYFKLWPADKEYFWDEAKNGFIAYKVVGPIAFALADPVCAANRRQQLIADFVKWSREHRLRACFMPIYGDGSLKLYRRGSLDSLQVGACALVNIETFLSETAQDKWWRWQKNRALKQGYAYEYALPPHSPKLMRQLKLVSDAWLANDRAERAFAMGYFDADYIQKCPLNYLKNEAGEVIAFSNQLPMFHESKTVSVDLLRHLPDANNAMPYLLFKTVENLKEQTDYTVFDLGFVPFASANNPVVTIARTLAGDRLSARGLEQFKNKFKPDWQPTYLAYDGDLGDLALIAVNSERAMRLNK